MDERVWDLRAVRALVLEWDDFVRGDRNLISYQWRREIVQAGTVLRDACLLEHLSAVEQRLGVVLPPSYRNFLLISNGAYASSLGAEVAGEDQHGYLPVEEIDWMPNADPEWTALWCLEDTPMVHGHPEIGRPSDEVDFRRARQGLLISRPSESFRDILVPSEAGDEWELWSTHSDGASAFASFADALGWQMKHRRQPGGDPARIDEYKAAAGSGDPQGLALLSDLDPQAAGWIAAECVHDPGLPWGKRAYAAGALGRLSASGAFDARHVLAQVADDDEALTPYLREARALTGDEAAIEELHTLADTSPDSAVRRLAKRALAQCGLDP